MPPLLHEKLCQIAASVGLGCKRHLDTLPILRIKVLQCGLGNLEISPQFPVNKGDWGLTKWAFWQQKTRENAKKVASYSHVHVYEFCQRCCVWSNLHFPNASERSIEETQAWSNTMVYNSNIFYKNHLMSEMQRLLNVGQSCIPG